MVTEPMQLDFVAMLGDPSPRYLRQRRRHIALQLARAGVSTREIEQRSGVSRDVAQKLRCALRITNPVRSQQEREAIIRQAQAMLDRGESLCEASRSLGVPRSTLHLWITTSEEQDRQASRSRILAQLDDMARETIKHG